MTVAVRADGWVRINELPVWIRFNIAGDGRLEPVAVEMIDSVLSVRALSEIPFGQIEAAANSPLVAETLQLIISNPGAESVKVRPSIKAKELIAVRERVQAVLDNRPTRYPEGFFKDIAYWYATAAANTSRPGQIIAEALGMPITTIWRWIRVCRERGLLPPARVGKEG